MLATACEHADRLVIGIDPVAAAMADASRRAALPARKGGLPNAAFVVAAAEDLPAELSGLATLVTVNLPWGSLLRGALALPDAGRASAGIASLLAPDGTARLLLAPAPRDRLGPEVDVVSRLAGTLEADWLAHGLVLDEARPATPADMRTTATTWARRLGLVGPTARASVAAPTDRPAWLLVLRRPAAGR